MEGQPSLEPLCLGYFLSKKCSLYRSLCLKTVFIIVSSFSEQSASRGSPLESHFPASDSRPFFSIRSYTSDEVTNKHEFISRWYFPYCCPEAAVEVFFGIIRILHSWSVSTDDGGLLVFTKWQFKLHKSIVSQRVPAKAVE